METLYFAKNAPASCETTITVCRLYYKITRIVIVETIVKIAFYY